MHIEKCSSINFGNVTNTIGGNGIRVLKKIKGENISHFRELVDNQEGNPINIEFYFSRFGRFCAQLTSTNANFVYDKKFRIFLFQKPIKFAEKVCNKADKAFDKYIYSTSIKF